MPRANRDKYNRNPGSGKAPHNGPPKGAGWGGDAKGGSESRLSEAGDDYSDAIRALARDPKHAEAKAPLRELVLATWVRVAQSSDNDGAAVLAADKLAKRVGLPEEPVETRITGEGGGPLTVTIRKFFEPPQDSPPGD